MFLYALFACNSTPTPAPPVVSTDPPLDTAPEFRQMETLTVFAQFGYDPTTGTAVATEINGTVVPPTFEIHLGPPGWSGDVSRREHCTVAYDLAGLAITQGPDATLDLLVPADTPTTTDCEGLDPDVWGEDPSEAFRPGAFGVTVGALDAEVQTWLEGQSAELQYYAGAVFHIADLVGEDEPFAYTNVFETDADLSLQFTAADDPIRLEATLLEPAAPVGWYTVTSGILWTVQ